MTVIVLAGGRGRRMNADKARLPVPGGTLLGRVLGQVGPLFDEVLVSVSPGQDVGLGRIGEAKVRTSNGNKMSHGIPQRILDEGGGLRLKIVRDEAPNLGPLGGIFACLKAARNDVCAVIACDIPDVDVALLRKLARATAEAEIAVPVTSKGDFEPLFAVYRKAIIPEIEKLLRAGQRSIIPLFSRCRTERVPLWKAGLLCNLNTRTDYEEYLKSLRSKRAEHRNSCFNNSRQVREKP